jgi:hypothetical protein
VAPGEPCQAIVAAIIVALNFFLLAQVGFG